MLIAFFYLVALGCVFYGTYSYVDLAGPAVELTTIEKEAALSMEARAHRLCMQAYEVQSYGNTWQRIKADEDFLDSLHLYVEDYQAEVATRIKEHNVKNIAAYGFIRIIK
jgi:hypothetical protein